MAQKRLRPGTWKLTEDNTANDKVQIDWTFFSIPKNTSITFDVQNIALYDDAHVEALRVPPTPQTIVGNTGVGNIIPSNPGSWWFGGTDYLDPTWGSGDISLGGPLEYDPVTGKYRFNPRTGREDIY
jgi:hypothetical protein